jgi:hypothetical protein
MIKNMNQNAQLTMAAAVIVIVQKQMIVHVGTQIKKIVVVIVINHAI